MAGLVGSALTIALIPLFGRRMIIPAGLIGLATMIIVLGHAASTMAFYGAVIAFKLGFLFYTVSMSGHFAATNSIARPNTLWLAAIGSSIVPAIGGRPLGALGYDGLSVAVGAAWLVVAVLVLFAMRAPQGAAAMISVPQA